MYSKYPAQTIEVGDKVNCPQGQKKKKLSFFYFIFISMNDK